MPCYYPVHGFRSATVNPATGKRALVFKRSEGFADMPCSVPCGQCVGCRLERSRQWAIRCVHESQMFSDNVFITLTYDDEHLPADGSVSVREWQLFMKRLRKLRGPGVRFFHCGEYGGKLGRPHYHAILFNCGFPDRVFYKFAQNGRDRLYNSPSLSQLWPLGFAVIGEVTFESAAYVARYCVKKLSGPGSREAYFGRKPEYATMSRRPGIGSAWFERFKTDVFPDDFCVVRGRRMLPPRFYDALLERVDPELFRRIKALRRDPSAEWDLENFPKRLAVREKVQIAKLKSLPRRLDNEDDDVCGL